MALIVLVLGSSWTCHVESRRQPQVKSLSTHRSRRTKSSVVSSQRRRVLKVRRDEERRQRIFKENSKFMEEFNSRLNLTFKLSTNSFAHLTHHEFKQSLTRGFKFMNPKRRLSSADDQIQTQSLDSDSTIPSTIDWRERNVVSPVKNQGRNCGSCWAFASVAAIEAITFINTGKMPVASEQQLVDCNQGSNTNGCGGGNQNEAFSYIIQNGGITSDSNYGYTAQAGSCKAGIASQAAARIRGFVEIPANDEAALIRAVDKQPVVALLDSSWKDFKFYGGGVYTSNCRTNLDHVVTIVGYGRSEEGINYWLIKNSWGTNWGENGYMRLERNSGSSEGRCGIAKHSSYPTM